jgi:hypothetical protein
LFDNKICFKYNETGRHDIAKILLKVALNTMKQTNKQEKAFNDVSLNSKSHPFGRSNWIVPIKLDYPPHFIEVAVRSQKSQRSSICELLMFSLSTNFL